jgi:mediator of RNA polymerase II transcription subunit 13, fungi type
VATALVSVDPSPAITLSPHLSTTIKTTKAPANPSIPTFTGNLQHSLSPDPQGVTTAATPTDLSLEYNPESDSHLVDITDETCGVILGHSFNNSNVLTEYRPGLATGLLIKRSGSQSPASAGNASGEATTNPACISINLLWLGSNGSGASQSVVNTGSQNSNCGLAGSLSPGPKGHKTILKDLLTTYRGLGTLAKLRGMRDTKNGLIPWHIVTVARAIKALDMCL